MNNSPRQAQGTDRLKAKPTASIRGRIGKLVFPALLAMKLGGTAAGCAETAGSTNDDRMADVATPDAGNNSDAMVSTDGTPMVVDAGTDAGSMAVDAGSMGADATPVIIPTPSDAGFGSADAGSMGVDGGSMGADAGTIVIPEPADAGVSSDAGSMGADA